MKHDNSSKLLKIAIEFGCKTVGDLAKFMKEYNPQIGIIAV